MSTTTATIRSVKARAVVAPISRPVKNAFGVIEAAPLVLIDVVTDQGVTGRSYIFAYAKLTLAPLVHLIEQIGGDLTGKAIAPFDLMAEMDAKFRLLGWQGLVGMAVSGLDMAFWDALGQLGGQPLARLLGGSPRPIRAYDSYGVVDPVADEKDLRRSLDRGFRSHPTICIGSRSRWPPKIFRAMRRCARPRRYRYSPARTGGFRAALPKRSPQARATSSCRI